MRTRLLRPRAAACALALVATAATSACATARRPTRAADSRTAIAAVAREFSARYERGDAAGMAALYTDDGVALPPGRAAVRGRAALEAYWRLAPGSRVTHHRVTPDSVVLAGPVAYDWGTYEARGAGADGKAWTAYGKYVIVWRETTPGTWRMHVDMWNAAPPPGGAARD